MIAIAVVLRDVARHEHAVDIIALIKKQISWLESQCTSTISYLILSEDDVDCNDDDYCV